MVSSERRRNRRQGGGEHEQQRGWGGGKGGGQGSAGSTWKGEQGGTSQHGPVEPEVTPEPNGAAAAVVSRVRAAAHALGLAGEIVTFGSHVNGFSTAHSDCDLSYMPEEGNSEETAVRVLQRFASELPKHGFEGIITVFQAIIPLVKAVDPSGAEVDLCVDNRLGHQNSKLVAAYCGLDPRVSQVGKLVKQWAKAWELVGSSDGHLSSYAYTLLTIYYLMRTKPPVLPNLQDLASQGYEPVIVRDRRWGREIPWDCKFWKDIQLIPRSSNTESVEALLRGFFEFYTASFDWVNDAVSVRLGIPNSSPTSKFGLYTSVQKEQWYVEDPFDLRHNLASQCTREGQQRILEKMINALEVLSATHSDDAVPMPFQDHCSRAPARFLLKCRVHMEKVTAPDLIDALQAARDVGPFSVNFPVAGGSGSREVTDAFAAFQSEGDRRRVHKLNETYVGAWQLRLLPCSSWALEDALKNCVYETFEVAAREPAADTTSAQRPRADDAAEEVRSGLRVAQSKSEVRVLIQRAQALRLSHEVELGKSRLRQLVAEACADPASVEPAAGEEGISMRFQ